MSSYVYSLIIDFPVNQIDTNQFHNEVIAASLTPNLIGIEINGDSVTIIFDAPLSGAEQTTLNAIVAAHIPVSDTGSIQPTGAVVNKESIINEVSPTRTTYTEVARMVWDNTRYINFRDAVCVFNSNIPGTSGIDIQIYDLANALELGTTLSSTTEYNRFSFNIPITNTEILVRLRRTSNIGSRPIINSLSLQFIC